MKTRSVAKLKKISGQPSWEISSDCVRLAVTRLGGQMAPVSFSLKNGEVTPYSVAPWAEEKPDPQSPGLLTALRGDFFCAPFGGNETPWRGEKHPPHGESANSRWSWESDKCESGQRTLHLSLPTQVRPGRLDKFLQLRDGETNIYCRHVLSGMSGPMNFGHHAMLRFPGGEGSGLVSTSRMLFGQVAPRVFEKPENGGYQCLKTGSEFTRLDRVPLKDGGFANLGRYPACRGFEDLVMLVHESQPDFAWTAVSYPGERFVWFALKDPRVLRSTIFWISNGGRHYPPWNGRHVAVLGCEDVTSYFHFGLADSARPNPVSRRGFATSLRLSRSAPLEVRYIMGVAAVPAGFGRVKSILRIKGGIRIADDRQRRVETPVDTSFLEDHAS